MLQLLQICFWCYLKLLSIFWALSVGWIENRPLEMTGTKMFKTAIESIHAEICIRWLMLNKSELDGVLSVREKNADISSPVLANIAVGQCVRFSEKKSEPQNELFWIHRQAVSLTAPLISQCLGKARVEVRGDISRWFSQNFIMKSCSYFWMPRAEYFLWVTITVKMYCLGSLLTRTLRGSDNEAGLRRKALQEICLH